MSSHAAHPNSSHVPVYRRHNPPSQSAQNLLPDFEIAQPAPVHPLFAPFLPSSNPTSHHQLTHTQAQPQLQQQPPPHSRPQVQPQVQPHPHGNPAKSQSQNNIYRNTWERPGLGISGCNVTALPVEAFEMANNLNIANPADVLAARSKAARPMGIGRCVQRLLQFNNKQKRTDPNKTVDNYWKPLIASFFTPDATFLIHIRDRRNHDLRSMKLPVEVLPRLWHSKFDAGIKEERILMENPHEFLLPTGVVVVSCDKAVVMTSYSQSTVVTNGYLRVTFQRNLKISEWEFHTFDHQELLSRNIFPLGALPPSAVSDFGIPASVVRLMYIAEDINEISSKINNEIMKLVAPSSKSQEKQLTDASASATHVKGSTSKPLNFTGISKGETNANAYRAILSQLDGIQSISADQGLVTSPVPVATPSPGVVSQMQGLAGGVQAMQNSLAAHMKTPAENAATAGLSDGISTWRVGQSTEMFPSLLGDSLRAAYRRNANGPRRNDVKSKEDIEREINLFADSMRHPYAQRDGDAARRGVSRGKDANVDRQIASSLGNLAESRRGQSAIDAVAAAASGQDGWGVGSARDGSVISNQPQDEGLDQNLQILHNADAAGDLSLSRERENSHGASRQKVPHGLVAFNPMAEDLQRKVGNGSGRERQQNASARNTGSANIHTPGNGHLKYNGKRGFQRMNIAKSKRDAKAVAASRAAVASNDMALLGASAGKSNPNVMSTKSGGQKSGTKAAKDHSHTSKGTRRSGTRTPNSDGREKRQKKASSGP